MKAQDMFWDVLQLSAEGQIISCVIVVVTTDKTMYLVECDRL